MALNLIVPKIISRKDGKSVIAKAAYNARTQLRDERTGELTKDYGKLGGLEWQGVFLDPRRKSPELSEWMHDRQALYNAYERKADESTRPKDAQLAREFLITLPHELNADQRPMLMTDFARSLARQGLIVDVSIHEPDVHSDERNYHAHVLLGMYRIDGNTGQLSAAKEREWNKKEWYQQVHERWSQLGARYLEKAGFKEEAERFRVGHLPREQQIERAEQRGDLAHADDLRNREATEHLGPQASAMERRGMATDAGNRNREIEQRNRDRAELRDIDRRIDAMQQGAEQKQQHRSGIETRILNANRDAMLDKRAKEGDPNPNVKALREALDKHGVAFARVNADEAARSHREAQFAKAVGRIAKEYREGEIVVVREQGLEYLRRGEWTATRRVHQLDQKEAEKYLTRAALDKNQLKGIEATKEELDDRARLRKIDMEATRLERATTTNGPHQLRTAKNNIRRAAGGVEKAGTRAIGGVFNAGETLLKALFSILDPPMTPLQRREAAERAKEEREAQAEREEERRRAEASRYTREREVDRER